MSEVWQDLLPLVLASAVVPADATAPHAVASFEFPPVVLDKIRVVNLLDLYEVEVY